MVEMVPLANSTRARLLHQFPTSASFLLDEDQVAANLLKNGPLAVGINAVYMQTYIRGVSCAYICAKRLDHGVVLVGYGSAAYSVIRFKEKPQWIITNS